MKPTFFTRRGVKTVHIKLDGWDESVDVVVCVPTNREHDEMMEAHTEYGMDGTVVTHSSDLIEYRLTHFIIDLPIEIPRDQTLESYVKWSDATEDEKINAVSVMEPDLRDAINNAITGVEELSEEEAGN